MCTDFTNTSCSQCQTAVGIQQTLGNTCSCLSGYYYKDFIDLCVKCSDLCSECYGALSTECTSCVVQTGIPLLQIWVILAHALMDIISRIRSLYAINAIHFVLFVHLLMIPALLAFQKRKSLLLLLELLAHARQVITIRMK